MNLFLKEKNDKIYLKLFAKCLCVVLSICLVSVFCLSQKAFAGDNSSNKKKRFVQCQKIKDGLTIGGTDASLYGYYGIEDNNKIYYSFYRVVPTNSGDYFKNEKGAYDKSDIELNLLDDTTKMNMMKTISDTLDKDIALSEKLIKDWDVEEAEVLLKNIIPSGSDADKFKYTFAGVSAALLLADYGFMVASEYALLAAVDTVSEFSMASSFYEGIEAVNASMEGISSGSALLESFGAAFGPWLLETVLYAIPVALVCYALSHSPQQVIHIHNLGYNDDHGVVNLDGIDGYDAGINVTWSYKGEYIAELNPIYYKGDSNVKFDHVFDCITISTPWSNYDNSTNYSDIDLRDRDFGDFPPFMNAYYYNTMFDKNIKNSLDKYTKAIRKLLYMYAFTNSGHNPEDFERYMWIMNDGYDLDSPDRHEEKIKNLTPDVKARLFIIKDQYEFNFDKSMRDIIETHKPYGNITKRNDELRINIRAYKFWYDFMSEKLREELGSEFVGTLDLWEEWMPDSMIEDQIVLLYN